MSAENHASSAAGGQPPLLRMRGIHKRFPGVVALDGVDLEVRRGEVHVLLGENGAGKSTLMKILAGACPKDAGEIQLDGRVVEIRTPRRALELGIATIYQELALVPQLSAAENILLGSEPLLGLGVIDRGALDQRATRALGDLGAGIDPETPVVRLSLAERQMVEVAKALSVEARVLVMDEPTSALTESEIERLFATIRRLKQRGVAVVYISHRLQEIAEIGDCVTVLRDGRNVATRQPATSSLPELIRLMADRDLAEHFPKRTVSPGEVLLKVDGLSRAPVLRDISFELRAGEVLGIAGLVGAGRTELARALFGVDRMDAGEVRVRGRRVRIRSPRDAIRLGLGFLSEDRKKEGLVLSGSVRANVALPNLDRVSRLGMLDRAAEAGLARRFVEALHIKLVGIEQRAQELSGGNQQKVVLAKWLAREADILIFDEPTRGIDVAGKVEIYKLINELTARGAGVLMISSELAEVVAMSDRILVMRAGTVVGELARAEADQQTLLALALGHQTAAAS